jgi:thioredoxin-related protein
MNHAMNLSLLIKTCAAVVALNCSGIAHAGGETWTSDFSAAQKEATEAKKDLLVNFTGSDWCSWCLKLHKEVLDQEPFKMLVKDRFVLVELDYPNDKTKLPEATLKQNEELKVKYPVPGLPSILLCDASGTPFAIITGYQDGVSEKYVTQLDEMRGKKAKRDEALDAASKSEGVEKAKILVGLLAEMGLTDAMVANFYGDVVAQIKASDPQDETGFAKAAAMRLRIEEIKKEFGGLMQVKNPDAALAVLDKALKDGDLPKDEVQQIMMTRGLVLGEQKKYDEAVRVLDEAKAFNPESPYAPNMDASKKRILEDKAKAAAGQ